MSSTSQAERISEAQRVERGPIIVPPIAHPMTLPGSQDKPVLELLAYVVYAMGLVDEQGRRVPLPDTLEIGVEILRRAESRRILAEFHGLTGDEELQHQG